MENERIKKAPTEILNEMYEMLNSKGVVLPQGDVDLMVSFMAHWLENTKRGHEYMIHLLKIKATRARDDEDHYINFPTSPIPYKLDTQKLFFLTGCVYENESLPVQALHSRKKETESCDSCGAGVICSQEFKGRTLCSNCLDCDEDHLGKDSIKISCENCNFIKCSWHPVNKDVPPESIAYY